MRPKVIASSVAAALILVGTASLSLAAPPVPAPTPDPASDAMVARIMKHLDVDKDGRISRAEAAGREKLSKNFDRIDTDRDGFLSRGELSVVVAKRLARKRAEGGF